MDLREAPIVASHLLAKCDDIDAGLQREGALLPFGCGDARACSTLHASRDGF